MRKPNTYGAQRAIDHQHRDLGSPVHPSGQQAGTQADPRRREHLEREPRADPTGDERRREQRRAPQHEPEPGTEDPAGEHDEEEDRLDAGDARTQRTKRGIDGGEHAQHGQRLGVHPALGQLRQDDRHQHRQHQHEQQRGVGGVPDAVGGRVREQRPAEHRQPRNARDRQYHGRAGAHPYGGWTQGQLSHAAPQQRSRLVDGEDRMRCEHLGHLRGEDGGVGERLAGRGVSDHLALGEHHDPRRRRCDELDVVGRDQDGMSGAASSVRIWRSRPLAP
jgi:hypothetical protein